MSKADFDKYYNSICSQYNELQLAVKELSVDVASGMVEPERLENLKLTIAPVEDNYRTLSYIKYLLDKPTRSKKGARYARSNKHLITKAANRTQDDLEEENKSIIQSVKL